MENWANLYHNNIQTLMMHKQIVLTGQIAVALLIPKRLNSVCEVGQPLIQQVEVYRGSKNVNRPYLINLLLYNNKWKRKQFSQFVLQHSQ
jgi:hypothetical protein